MANGLEALIDLGHEIDEMTFEPLENLEKFTVDEDGTITDPNTSGIDSQLVSEEGSGWYTTINGEDYKLGTAASVIAQGVSAFTTEQMTNIGAKVPETLKGVVTKFNRSMS